MITPRRTLTVALIVVAGAWIYQTHKASQLRGQNRALQQQQAELSDQLKQLRGERDEATNRLAAMSDELAGVKKTPSEILKLRSEVGALREEKANTESQSALSRIAANPEAWKAMRDEQKRAMTALYASLAKQLKLTPEQTEQFNNLMADHVMDNVSLITQSLHDGKSQADVRQIFAASDAAFESKVQSSLGDDALTQYQDYNKNLGNNIIADAFAGTLTGDQATVVDKRNRLLQVLQEATQSELAAAGLPPNYQTLTVLNFANFASEAEGTQNLQLKDRILGNAAGRAATFLNEDELKKFQDFRAEAIKNSQNIILVNRKLMGPVSQ